MSWIRWSQMCLGSPKSSNNRCWSKRQSNQSSSLWSPLKACNSRTQRKTWTKKVAINGRAMINRTIWRMSGSTVKVNIIKPTSSIQTFNLIRIMIMGRSNTRIITTETTIIKAITTKATAAIIPTKTTTALPTSTLMMKSFSVGNRSESKKLVRLKVNPIILTGTRISSPWSKSK